MSMIKKMYQMYLNEEETQYNLGNIELRKSSQELDNYIENLNLNFKTMNRLQELINYNNFCSEEQSFVTGFKYAMSLLKEC